jgi:tetratricopeptide (TPR) repeat protein
MLRQIDEKWLLGQISLGAATEWTREEMRLIAELGYALAELGHNVEAIRIFEGLAALSPATAYFQAALGALQLRTGELGQALTHLDAALSADSTNLAALVNRGEVYLNLGNRTDAVNNLRAALKILPRHEEEIKAATRARALLACIE